MEELGTQELFLLEFLIDKVNIPSVQAMQDDTLHVKTCIEFRILNLPPIDICQDSANRDCVCLGEDAQVFRKGKSCLFALQSKLLNEPLCTFPVTMTVYKKLPPSVLPDVMTIGTCRIETRDMINCLLVDCSLNPYRTLKKDFMITTATGQCVGEVGLYLRFSRLGRRVVTQFQNPHNKKPYLFKGLEDGPVYQCRKIPSETPISLDCEGPATQKVQKNCCETISSAAQQKSGKSKKSRKSKRPCCSASKSQTKGCEKNTADNLCDNSNEQKTRKCGCEVKEDKFQCSK